MESQHGPREGCPGLETLAAYADGTLDAGQREAVAAHLTSCEDCYEVFVETARFKQEEAKAAAPGAVLPGRWPARRRWVAGLASLAAAGLVGVAIFGPGFPSRDGRSPAFRELVKAIGTTRPIEPRLAGFEWGPSRPRTRGPLVPETQPSRVLAAAARVEEEAGTVRSGGAPSQWDLGVAELVIGKTDAAIERLEEAVRTNPRNAALLADLSAAWLVKAQQAEGQQAAAKALEAASGALAIDAGSLEGLFNRALAIERLGAAAEAKRAWAEYLARDADSKWAEEARKRGEALKSELPRESRRSEKRAAIGNAARRGGRTEIGALVVAAPDSAREALDRDLLPAWAAATSSGQTSLAKQALEETAIVANAYADVTDDGFYRDIVSGLAPGDAPGVGLLSEGGAAFDERQLGRAKEKFAAALRAFASSRDLLRLLTAYRQAACAYELGELPETEARLAEVRGAPALPRYRWLSGRVHRLQALLEADRGSVASAVEHLEQALSIFESMHDGYETAATHSRLASNLSTLGDSRAVWTHVAAALAGSEGVSGTEFQTLRSHAALAARKEGLPRVSLEFLDSILEAQRWHARPRTAAWASLMGAESWTELGEISRASAGLERAGALGPAIRQTAYAQRFDADLEERRAFVMCGADAETAIAAATKAMNYFEKVEPERLPQLLLARGKAQKLAGRLDLAEADFEQGIQEVERRWAIAGNRRISYFDRAFRLFDEMIRLQAVDRGAPERALDYAERSRARDLLERTSKAVDAAARPISSREMHGRLANRHLALVYFVCLPERVLSWLITPRGIAFRDQLVPAERVGRLSRRLVEALENGAPWKAMEADAAELYDVLVRPLEPTLSEEPYLVFIPDAALSRIPFAALFDRRTREFLVERRTIGVSPSASLLFSNPRGPGRASHALSALVVGAPASEDPRASRLPDLPGARAEAETIAGAYSSAVLLVGREAKRERFLRLAYESDVVHFAGHAEVDFDNPGRSRLFLASERGEPGFVTADELAKGARARTRLFVLAGCRTAVGQTYRGEGVLDLSRPILGAGVPDVVGTLWKIEDGASRKLFTDFHKRVIAGETPAAALAAAQRTMLRSPDEFTRRPTAWAGVQVVSTLSL